MPRQINPHPSALDLSEQIRRLDAYVDAIDDARANPPATDLSVPWEIFARKCRMLTPQAYGPRFEKYFMTAFGWTKVPSKDNRGDIKDAQGDYYEVKTTVITGSNPNTNFVQLRPHQDITGYHLFIVDTEYRITHLTLTKAQMNAEIANLGSSAHGTKDAVAGNQTREYAIRFDWTPDSGTARDWIRKYLAAPVGTGHVLSPHMIRHTELFQVS